MKTTVTATCGHTVCVEGTGKKLDYLIEPAKEELCPECQAKAQEQRYADTHNQITVRYADYKDIYQGISIAKAGSYNADDKTITVFIKSDDANRAEAYKEIKKIWKDATWRFVAMLWTKSVEELKAAERNELGQKITGIIINHRNQKENI